MATKMKSISCSSNIFRCGPLVARVSSTTMKCRLGYCAAIQVFAGVAFASFFSEPPALEICSKSSGQHRASLRMGGHGAEHLVIVLRPLIGRESCVQFRVSRFEDVRKYTNCGLHHKLFLSRGRSCAEGRPA